MLDKSQDILRLSFAAAALLIGGSVAYHYAIYVPAKDRDAKEAAAAKDAAEERRRDDEAKAAEATAFERRAGYRICVSNAIQAYSARWDASCRVRSEQAEKDRADCVARGVEATVCQSYYPSIPAQDCRLPNALSDDYDRELRDEKAQCLAEAEKGLAGV